MSRLRWLIAMILAVVLIPDRASAQDMSTVTVQIVEAGTQRPLAGVQVAVPPRVNALTDQNGRAQFQVARGNHTLRISIIGYKSTTREVTSDGRAVNLSVSLETDPLRLDELVVTGYTSERRKYVSGAITSVKPEATKEVPVTQIHELMRGRAPGVQVVQNSGTPGSAITVRVRGSSSINGGNDPLYVIDGVPMIQGNHSRLGGFGGQSIDAVGDLNANEIESIEILKDASAAAIYGSRASNGVVLITTKKGHTGRPDITFGAYYGEQKHWREIDLLNAAQYTEVYNEGCQARFSTPCVGFRGESTDYVVRVEAIRGADTDWLHEVLGPAPIGSMEASIRGGFDKVRYYVSGSSLDQEGIEKDLGYRKLNARVNLDYSPAERLTLGTNVALARALTQRAANDNTIVGGLANAIAMAPVYPVRGEDGKFFTGFYWNPVGNIENREARERSVRILGNVFGNYSLMDGVSAKLSAGVDHYNLRGQLYHSPLYGNAASVGGRGTDGSEYVTKLQYEGTLNFNRMLATAHEISGVVGGSMEDNTESGATVSGENFPNEFFKFLTSAATINSGNSTRTDYGLVSYFGRVSYTWREKVTTTFNVRRDGSSRFGANNRFGNFPSLSVNWRVGDESFIAGQNIVSNLSVRASYGVTGNQQGLGNFQSRALFVGGANYMDSPGIRPSQLANADLRWEKTKQSNFGADFAVLSNRLKFAIDYYQKDTDDLLYQRPLPRSTGFANITSNIGSMENKGVDLGITADLLQAAGDGLNFSTTLSLSRNRNKVTALYNDQNVYGQNSIIVGQPLGVFYGYIADGIFQTMEEVKAHATQVTHTDPRRATAPGDIRFKDINGRGPDGKLTGVPDGVVNADDRDIMGNPWPDYEGGLTNNLSFKGFDMTAFFQFSQGNDIYNGIRTYMDRFGSDGDNHTTRALNRWTPSNTNTTEPRAIWGDPNQNTRTSSRFVEDGSYWRLKNLVVGYKVPQSIADKAGARSMRIYVQGQNLITETKYSGFDPEVNSAGNHAVTRGWDFYALPQSRTITFGFNIGY